MNKALFLDRDGTIVKEIPGTGDSESFGYLTKAEDVELIEGSADAIALAKENGFKTIIITNQSAIARGWITEEDFRRINDRMFVLLKQENSSAIIDDVFYCPFHPDGTIERYKKLSENRKPGTGMIIEAKAKHDIDLSGSYIIGDALSDIQCGNKAGIKSVLVLTGYGKSAKQKLSANRLTDTIIKSNLLDAVKSIIEIEHESNAS